MPAELRLTPAAPIDLDIIWEQTVARWSAEQAEAYILQLNESFRLLCDFPEMARERAEISPPIRLHPSGRHLILYRLEAGALVILRVVHQRQNWSAWLSE